MSGGGEISWQRGRAEDGKAVGRARTQAGPGVVDAHLSDLGHDIRCGMLQALNGVRIYALVEAGVLDGCAQDNAAVAARDDVYLRRAHGVLDQRAGMMVHPLSGTTQSICPFTGRVGAPKGLIWAAHAPAQFTTVPAA